MPIPVIDTTTSVLEGAQWQPFTYQPFATNTPTSWACPNLPTGLSITAGTGKISGTPEVSGVFVCGLTATNGDGTSAPLALTIGIAPGSASVTRPGTEIEIDAATGVVTFPNGEPGVMAKTGKDLLLWVRFKKGDAILDLDLDALSLTLREFDPDSNLVVSSDWKKYGSGTGTYYGIYARVDSAAAVGAASSYEADAETQFEGKAEIQYTEDNPDADLGPDALLFASRNFPITVATSQA